MWYEDCEKYNGSNNRINSQRDYFKRYVIFFFKRNVVNLKPHKQRLSKLIFNFCYMYNHTCKSQANYESVDSTHINVHL